MSIRDLTVGFYINIDPTLLFEKIDPKVCEHSKHLDKNLKMCPFCKEEVNIKTVYKYTKEYDHDWRKYTIIDQNQNKHSFRVDNEKYLYYGRGVVKIILNEYSLNRYMTFDLFATKQKEYEAILKNTPLEKYQILYGCINL